MKLVLCIALGIAGVPALALAADSTTAPPGKADSTVVQTSDGTGLSNSSADTSDGGNASASAVNVQGEPPSDQMGGTQAGDGKSSGSTADTNTAAPDAPADAQVTPWQATVGSSDGCTDASGD